jgi:hypothetical protein
MRGESRRTSCAGEFRGADQACHHHASICGLQLLFLIHLEPHLRGRSDTGELGRGTRCGYFHFRRCPSGKWSRKK